MKTFGLRLVVCLLPGLLVAMPRAQAAPSPGDPVDLAGMLEPLRAEHGVPAIGAAVIVDGRLTALGVTGVRKHGDATKVTVDDLWHLGSCTKAMTATLLARQVEAGRLVFSTTLGEALPELRERMHVAAREITVAQLLQHRSGLPGQPPDRLWHELFRFEGGDTAARREVAATMLAMAPEAAPGERYHYSNAGYMIAGLISEQVGDLAWQQLMQRELFAPLGMRSVGFGPPGDRDGVTQPWGHRPGNKGPKPVFHDNPPSLGPAGTVHCTLRDWAQFARLHLGVDPTAGEPLLTEAMLAQLHRPPAGFDYALGWSVTRRGWAPGPILSHTGSNTMWFCCAWLAPEARFAVLVTCNQGEAAGACDAIAAACIRRFRP